MSIRTIADDLSSAAERDPDRVALIARDREVSYAEFDRLAGGFAAGLAELGRCARRPGGGAAPQRASTPRSRSRAPGARGPALAALNPTIKGDSLDYVLADIEPAVIVCDAERAELARAAAERAGGIPVVSDAEPGGERGSAPAAAAADRPRRGHVHVGLDRRPQGSDAHPPEPRLRHRARSWSTWR